MPNLPKTPDVDVTQRMYAEDVRERSLELLAACLRTELAAVDTYDLALKSTKRPDVSRTLLQLRGEHELRATILHDHLRAHGIEPAASTGAWGAFSKLVQSGADVFGDKVAVSVLEEFEDRALSQYAKKLYEIDAESRWLIEDRLLPGQMRSHDLCRSLKRELIAA